MTFNDLFTKPLKGKDAVAFQLHAVEVRKWNWNQVIIGSCKKRSRQEEASLQIFRNFCARTGVNIDRFVRYMGGKYWMEMQAGVERSKWLRP